MKIAFLFSGQGAQYAGMGKELYDNYECAKRVFDEADEALGFKISDLCFNGPKEKLDVTEMTQPSIVTMSTAALAVVEEHGIKPDVIAGLSLGEYSAHVASGSIGFTDAVRLVQKRGRYMQEAVKVGEGAMAAVIGMDVEVISKACQENSAYGVVEIANFNCPGQIVIGGSTEAVDKACETLQGMGGRVVKLSVSGPFHTSLMQPAAEKLGVELQNVEIGEMNIPVITNVTGDYIKSASDIRELLVKQVTSSVQFEKSIRRMIEDGVDTFVEIGPGKVLTGFLRKIDRSVKALNVEDLKSLENTLKKLV